ncbi:hypothetical protein [Paenibacillus sp. Leaf72]|nr:hypothetical protein [Paenibacillus sp. Leaf72]
MLKKVESLLILLEIALPPVDGLAVYACFSLKLCAMPNGHY